MDRDVMDLLKMIKGIVHQFDDLMQGVFALVQATRKAINFIQEPKMTNDEYSEQLKAIIDIVEAYGRNYGSNDGLVKAELQAAGVADPNASTVDQVANATEIAKRNSLHACTLAGPIENYNKLKDEFQKSYTLGMDN